MRFNLPVFNQFNPPRKAYLMGHWLKESVDYIRYHSTSDNGYYSRSRPKQFEIELVQQTLEGRHKVQLHMRSTGL